MEADANPFPNDETTPPVIKMYFVLTFPNGALPLPLRNHPGVPHEFKNRSINSNPFLT